MDAVEEIKRRIDTAEYIGRVVRLQKSGRNFRGLCPFHGEKTPSFYVFPDRGTWRCFGSCGEGGDLFSFVQKRESIDFRTAIRTLAEEAGVQLSAEAAQKRGRFEQLSAIMSAAVDYYQRQLQEDGGQAAREYLSAKRGLSDETIEAFRIGWAPDDWRGLHDYLTARGYAERDITATGLLVESESGGAPYDRFRGRVIIPIADERGQFVGMGGRGLHGEEPKYLNTPQSELFDKGRTMYGLHLATAAIKESGVAVVVEGYMDVIGPHQAGFRNVVATMGTSLTTNHAALLKRLAKRVVLAMDPDAAGLAAAERAGSLFIASGTVEGLARSVRTADSLTTEHELEIRVAPLPAGKDPDEIARDDPEGWGEAIAGAAPYTEFLLKRAMGEGRPDSAVEARRLVDRLRPILLAVSDPVERSTYIQRVARHLGVEEGAVTERMRQGMPSARSRPQRPFEPRGPRATREETLLAIVLRHPHLRHEVRNLPLDLFTESLDRELFRRWVTGEEFVGNADEDPVIAHARRLEGLRLPPLVGENGAKAVQQVVRDVLRDRLMQRQVAVTEELAEAERSLGANRVAEVGNQVWRGGMPSDEAYGVAETVIEELELGLSLHRKEAPL
ncbi:MAG: DNA primase [Tepidiformaceae bacterium]